MRKRVWLRLVVLAMVVLLVASWSVSRALEYGWARRSLLARLEATLGRPVDVGHFEFSLLSGPKLEADSVSIAEDPRFGQEYFLRSEQLTAVLRWTALLHGRIEFGSLSLTRPSLNLVRNADGHWNIENWLPPLKNAPVAQGSNRAGLPPTGALSARLLDDIEVDDGRINFKLETDKLPFALVGVSGHLEQNGAGHWSLDLTADPMSTSVALQDAGTLRLRGTIAGTSAGLQPAELTLTWEQASLADAVRLASGEDYGMRGELAAEFTVRIANASENQAEDSLPARAARPAGDGDQTVHEAGTGAIWTMAGNIHFQGVHRWDLASRATDPAVTASFTAAWRPGRSRIEVSRYVVESPRSRLDAVGALDWSNGFHPYAQILSSHIAFDDVLTWRRAFQPAIADDLTIDGAAGGSATIVDWPPRVEQAHIASQGAVVHAGALGVIRFGLMDARLDRGSLVLAPVQVSLPGAPEIGKRSRSSATAPVSAAASASSGGTLRVEGALGPFRAGERPSDWGYRVAVSGDTQRAQDLMTAAAAFGRTTNKDWSIDGPATLHLVWKGALRHGKPSTNGTVELHDLQLNTVLMNQPMVVSASIELRPGERRVKITSAEALGTNWKGSLDQTAANREWNFDLAADRLDAAQLDLWLGPRARLGMLDRMLPFSAPASQAPPRDVAIASLEAHGRLRIGDVALAPLHIEKLDAAAQIHGRSLVLQDAQASFYGGRVGGEFEAHLETDPTYAIDAQIDRTNLAALITAVTTATGSLSGQAGGLASGVVRLAAHGIGRENLLASLKGDGDLRIREALVSGLHSHSPQVDAPPQTAAAEEAQAASETHFSMGTATFRIDASHVRVNQLLLVGRQEQFQIDGAVDFAGRLDLHVLSMPRGSEPAANSESSFASGEWVVGGTLAMPQWSRQTDTAGDRDPTPRAHR